MAEAKYLTGYILITTSLWIEWRNAFLAFIKLIPVL